LAEKHGRAHETGPHNPNCEEVSPFSGYVVERMPLSMDDDVMKLKYLGSGFPLFY
jgi:hypothetical protein